MSNKMFWSTLFTIRIFFRWYYSFNFYFINTNCFLFLWNEFLSKLILLKSWLITIIFLLFFKTYLISSDIFWYLLFKYCVFMFLFSLDNSLYFFFFFALSILLCYFHNTPFIDFIILLSLKLMFLRKLGMHNLAYGSLILLKLPLHLFTRILSG